MEKTRLSTRRVACLPPALREIEGVATVLAPAASVEGRDLGYYMTTIQIVLAVVGFASQQVARPVDAARTPGDAVVNVVYKDVLEVGEARCSTQVGDRLD